MGYRLYPERVEPIGSKEGVADTDMDIVVNGYDGMRATIPCLSILTGATAQSLTVIQVKDIDTVINLSVGDKEVSVEEIDEDLSGRFAAIETVTGDWFVSKVTSSALKVHTLTDAFPSEGLKEGGRFFIFASVDDELNQRRSLEADTETVFSQSAPGVFASRDYCFPLILHMTNDTNPLTLQGGMAVYISR